MRPTRVLVTGGAGFIGSHVAERLAREGASVTVLDNLSRASVLPTADRREGSVTYNWKHLEAVPGVSLVRADVRDADAVAQAAADVDAIVHAAAQVAVTTSLTDPRHDFEVNALGTLNVLEAARRSRSNPAVLLASTNKVYGENVNAIPVRQEATRYVLHDPAFADGIPETLPIDHAKHTPYGVSKLAADLYAQDYAKVYGIRTGVFRMSCIYGDRQFGNEDQGWVAHFVLASLRGKPITVYGDGKQVRDVLHVSDLVDAYVRFLYSDLRHGVYNLGGGPRNTVSLRELFTLIEKLTGRAPTVRFDEWRAGDQKVFVSDVRKTARELGWAPKVSPEAGVEGLLAWARRTGLDRP